MRTQLAQRKNQRIRITTEIIKITPIKKAKNTIYKLALRNITSTEFTGKVNHLYISISAASLPKEDLLILETLAKKEKHPKTGQSRFGRGFGLYRLQGLPKLAAKPQPTRIAATSVRTCRPTCRNTQPRHPAHHDCSRRIGRVD